jgi:selenium-binding protein 1
VTNPFEPILAGVARIGGMVRRTGHPARPGVALNGGPQMVEISRDGKRVYISNGLYTPWDEQFYPDGIQGWLAKLDVGPAGGMAFDPRFFLELDAGMRSHQVRLQGGDASSDSFCYA